MNLIKIDITLPNTDPQWFYHQAKPSLKQPFKIQWTNGLPHKHLNNPHTKVEYFIKTVIVNLKKNPWLHLRGCLPYIAVSVRCSCYVVIIKLTAQNTWMLKKSSLS